MSPLGYSFTQRQSFGHLAILLLLFDSEIPKISVRRFKYPDKRKEKKRKNFPFFDFSDMSSVRLHLWTRTDGGFARGEPPGGDSDILRQFS